MKIGTFHFSNNLYYPILVRNDSLPVFLSLQYLITSSLKSKAYNTKYNHISVISRLYQYFELSDEDLDELLICGNFEKVLNIIRNLYNTDLENFSLKISSYENFIMCIRNFILWALENFISKNYSQSHKLEKLNRINKKRIYDFFASLSHKYSNKIREFHNINEVDKNTILGFLAPNNNTNPFIRENQIRNFLIFKILLETGIRLGELLSLQTIDHITNSQTSLLKIKRVKIESLDSRKNKPYLKNANSERLVLLSNSTSEILNIYVNEYRKPIYNGKKRKLSHPFLFVSSLGNPISKATVDKIFSVVNATFFKLKIENSTSVKRITPHSLRHTFSYEFLKYLIEIKEIDMERAKDELCKICGWKEDSIMPIYYAGRYIWETANNHNRERINKYYE